MAMLTLNDGRELEFETFGDPTGRTVVFHHGTPGASSTGAMMLAEGSDLFVVTYSRAGYGHSSRHEGRRVADVVTDVDQLLNHLQRDQYIAIGWSGGGPHALACAALGAPRCEAAISLAGVVPMDVDFDWTAGMAPENIEEFRVAAEGGAEYEAHMLAAAEGMSGASEENIFDLFGGLLPPVDRDAIDAAGVKAAFASNMRHAFATGHFGFYDDDRAFFSPWGFAPQDIAVPVSLYYGDADAMVPPTHGAWLAAHVPNAREHFVAGEGHVSIVTRHAGAIRTELNSLGR